MKKEGNVVYAEFGDPRQSTVISLPSQVLPFERPETQENHDYNNKEPKIRYDWPGMVDPSYLMGPLKRLFDRFLPFQKNPAIGNLVGFQYYEAGDAVGCQYGADGGYIHIGAPFERIVKMSESVDAPILTRHNFQKHALLTVAAHQLLCRVIDRYDIDYGEMQFFSDRTKVFEIPNDNVPLIGKWRIASAAALIAARINEVERVELLDVLDKVFCHYMTDLKNKNSGTLDAKGISVIPEAARSYDIGMLLPISPEKLKQMSPDLYKSIYKRLV